MERERGDLLRTKYDSKKYERESVCKIFGERFKISLWRFTRTMIFIIILRKCIINNSLLI